VPGGTVPSGSVDAEMICRLDRLWAARTPAAVMIQGDGGAGLPAALAAFWRRIPVVHLDAGRRSSELGETTAVEQTGGCSPNSPPFTWRPPRWPR